MSEENKEKEKAKNVRRGRGCKGSAYESKGKMMLDAKRSAAEIQATAKDAKNAYDNLGNKHDEYTMFLDDEEYKEAERWIEQCTREYTEFVISVNDYENNEKKEIVVTPHEEPREELHDDVHAAEVLSSTENDPNLSENIPQQEMSNDKDGENSSVKFTSPKPMY